MAMNFGTNLLPTTNGDKTLGSADKKWDLYVDAINGQTFSGSPIVVTTTNASASDALTIGAQTINANQLIFVFLNKAMSGSADATLKVGSGSAVGIYIDTATQLRAPYKAGTLLGLIYTNSKFYMINPPVAV